MPLSAVAGAGAWAAIGDESQLSDEQNLRHAMLTSSAYNDLKLPIGIFLWAELAFAAIDVAALAKTTLGRIRGHLAAVNRTLDEWRWLEDAATRPVMLADCLLWEELSVAQHVLGEHLKLDETPTLARFYRECKGRPAFERLLEERPCQVTGRPGEAAAIANIHRLLATDQEGDHA